MLDAVLDEEHPRQDERATAPIQTGRAIEAQLPPASALGSSRVGGAGGGVEGAWIAAVTCGGHAHGSGRRLGRWHGGPRRARPRRVPADGPAMQGRPGRRAGAPECLPLRVFREQWCRPERLARAASRPRQAV